MVFNEEGKPDIQPEYSSRGGESEAADNVIGNRAYRPDTPDTFE